MWIGCLKVIVYQLTITYQLPGLHWYARFSFLFRVEPCSSAQWGFLASENEKKNQAVVVGSVWGRPADILLLYATCLLFIYSFRRWTREMLLQRMLSTRSEMRLNTRLFAREYLIRFFVFEADVIQWQPDWSLIVLPIASDTAVSWRAVLLLSRLEILCTHLPDGCVYIVERQQHDGISLGISYAILCSYIFRSVCSLPPISLRVAPFSLYKNCMQLWLKTGTLSAVLVALCGY